MIGTQTFVSQPPPPPLPRAFARQPPSTRSACPQIQLLEAQGWQQVLLRSSPGRAFVHADIQLTELDAEEAFERMRVSRLEAVGLEAIQTYAYERLQVLLLRRVGTGLRMS